MKMSQFHLFSDSVSFLQKVEPWEADKTEADMEKYVWEINQSKKSIVDLIQRLKESKVQQNIFKS